MLENFACKPGSLRVSLRFDVLHTVINSVYVQTLPTEQATSVVTDFFSRGHDPFAHACKARPLTIVGRTSLSVSLSLSFNEFGARFPRNRAKCQLS